MKTFHLFDNFTGNSYADMINHALGTNFDDYKESGVPLDEFGLPGVIAWFVFMDGSTHGYPPDYLWSNRLIDDTIIEELVSKNHTKVIQKDDREGHYPLRLAFELLECEKGFKGFYKCRFVGAFVLSHFLRQDLTAREYVRVIDKFTLKSKGDFGKILNTKTDFFKDMPPYATPVEEMSFSKTVLLLLRGHISTAGELLELGLDAKGAIADEIRQKLYEHFKKPEEKTPPAPIATSKPLPGPFPVPQIYVGMAVSHAIYGDGNITQIADKHLTVSFPIGEKQFGMPHCFAQGFLKAK